MILLAKIISYIGLGLTVVPSILLLSDGFDDLQYQMLAIVGMVLWFATAPFWINRTSEEEG